MDHTGVWMHVVIISTLYFDGDGAPKFSGGPCFTLSKQRSRSHLSTSFYLPLFVLLQSGALTLRFLHVLTL
jgi:hypothetical protein